MGALFRTFDLAHKSKNLVFRGLPAFSLFGFSSPLIGARLSVAEAGAVQLYF